MAQKVCSMKVGNYTDIALKSFETTIRVSFLAILIFLSFAKHAVAERISNEVLRLEQKAIKGDLISFQALVDMSKNDPGASKILGIMYFKGLGTKKDVAKGLGYFEQAAKQGDKESAQFLVKFFSSKNSSYFDTEKSKFYQTLLQEKESLASDKLPNSPDTYNKGFSWRPFVEPNLQLRSLGSGFAINSNGHFVTNHHVVNGCSKLVVFYNEKKSYGEVIASSKELDLAIVNVAQTTPFYLSIKPKSPQIGDKVKAAGFPAEYFKFSEGVVSAVPKNSQSFQFSASISSGSSGGPVVDQASSVVGIAVGGFAPGKAESGNIIGADFNFAIHSSHLVNFLAANSISFTQSEAAKIFSEADIAKILQKTTVLINCY
jgi:S1-C subfamily serine protease